MPISAKWSHPLPGVSISYGILAHCHVGGRTVSTPRGCAQTARRVNSRRCRPSQPHEFATECPTQGLRRDPKNREPAIGLSYTHDHIRPNPTLHRGPNFLLATPALFFDPIDQHGIDLKNPEGILNTLFDRHRDALLYPAGLSGL